MTRGKEIFIVLVVAALTSPAVATAKRLCFESSAQFIAGAGTAAAIVFVAFANVWINSDRSSRIRKATFLKTVDSQAISRFAISSE
jgi:hypothetical protein